MNTVTEQTTLIPAITIPPINEAAGEIYAGILLGKNGEKSRHIIVVATRAEALDFAENEEWIKTTGGRLATRREGALVYANAAEDFDKSDWYWLEAHAERSGCAWFQYFYSGIQRWSIQDVTCFGLSVRSVDID